MELLRRIGYYLRLTKEVRTGMQKESEILLSDTSKVIYKKHFRGILTGLEFMGVYGRNEQFNIWFRGQKTSFYLNNKNLFKRFEVDEEVKVRYMEDKILIYDYLPSDFNKKKLLEERTFNKFVRAEKA